VALQQQQQQQWLELCPSGHPAGDWLPIEYIFSQGNNIYSLSSVLRFMRNE